MPSSLKLSKKRHKIANFSTIATPSYSKPSMTSSMIWRKHSTARNDTERYLQMEMQHQLLTGTRGAAYRESWSVQERVTKKVTRYIQLWPHKLNNNSEWWRTNFTKRIWLWLRIWTSRRFLGGMRRCPLAWSLKLEEWQGCGTQPSHGSHRREVWYRSNMLAPASTQNLIGTCPLRISRSCSSSL